MTTYRQAIEETGAIATPGTDLVIAMLPNGGRIRHYVATNLAEQIIDETTNVYLASGTFEAGTVNEHGGRSETNLRSILWLPFDADLADYTTLNAAYLHSLPQTEIDTMITAQREDLERVFREVGMRIHRLDYTGYGLCAYLYIEAVEQSQVDTVRSAHKALIKRINDHAGFRLVDPQVSDAGTRITRLPGTMNTKNPDLPRRVTTLARSSGQSVTLDQLRFAERRASEPPKTPGLPESKELPASVAHELVDAIKPHWTLGQKHATALALAGMLAKSGVPEAQALAIIEALSVDDDKPWDRQRCVHDTYTRLRSGVDTRGYSALQDLLPATVMQFVSTKLDRFRDATTFTFGPTPSNSPAGGATASFVTDLKIEPIPDVCYRGWVGNYVEMMLPLSEAPESFHLGAGLALMGATAGRRVSAEYVSRPLYGNLFMMLVGLAGESRKDTAIEFAINLPHKQTKTAWNDPPFKIASDIGSAEGLVKILSEQPNTWLYITEYQRLSRQGKRQSTGTIFSMMISAWNTPPALENNTKGEPLVAKLPYLSAIAAVQPKILAEEMTPEDLESGFASRWLYVPGEGRDPIPYPPNIDAHEAFSLYAELCRTMAIYEKNHFGATILKMTQPAIDHWTAWYMADRRRKIQNEDEASIRSRLSVHIQKLALLYAASAGAMEIDIEHLEPAIAFVEWSWRHTQQMMKNWGSTIDNQIETRIERVLTDRGPMKRRILQGYVRGRKFGTKDFGMVLDSMIKNGTVEQDPEGALRYVGS